MAHRILLLSHRRMELSVLLILIMIAPDGPVTLFSLLLIEISIHAPDIHKVLGQFQTFRVLCQTVHFHQSKFHLRMSRIARVPLFNEYMINMGYVFLHNL